MVVGGVTVERECGRQNVECNVLNLMLMNTDTKFSQFYFPSVKKENI